jgi:uncharacterized damage-inducible protein DinB
MRSQDVLALFDYSYWATWSLLAAISKAPPDAFTAPRTFTWRNLRDTLVHMLDVEQSWRRRLQGEAREIWDAELSAERFSSPSELETYWRADAAEMTIWLASLDDAALAAVVDLGPRDRFPLWIFLVHIVTHDIEQRRDVATLLTQLGVEVPELEFLWYADSVKPPDADTA